MAWWDHHEDYAYQHVLDQAMKLEKKAKRVKNKTERDSMIKMIVYLRMQAEQMQGNDF